MPKALSKSRYTLFRQCHFLKLAQVFLLLADWILPCKNVVFLLRKK